MRHDQFADRTAAVFKNEKTGHWEEISGWQILTCRDCCYENRIRR